MATSTVSVEAYELEAAGERKQYISWPAIFAGNAVAGGLILLMLPLSAAAGLAMVSPYSSSSASGTTIGTAAIVWLAFVYLFSIFAGAYVAGRLRPRQLAADEEEIRFRDGMNGLVVWGVGMIVSAIFTYMSLTAALGTAVSAIGQATGGALSGVGSAAGSAMQQQGLPGLNTGYLADLFLRTNNGQQAATTPNAPQRSEDEVRGEIGRIIAASAMSGQVSDADRAYLATLVAQRTGASTDEAKKHVDESIQRVNEMRDQAVAETKAAAESARKAAAQGAFWTAVMSLIAAIVAYYAARLGGEHRDEPAALATR